MVSASVATATADFVIARIRRSGRSHRHALQLPLHTGNDSTEPMTDKRRVRPRLGDIVRIRALDGRAADAQYTHKHPGHGALLRVLGAAPDEPTPVGDDQAAVIAAQPTQFVAFFPLGAACARGIAEIVGGAPIPDESQPFPTFRVPGRRPWWLWDGEQEVRLEEMPADYPRLPIRAIINDTLLVARAHDGWRAEWEV